MNTPESDDAIVGNRSWTLSEYVLVHNSLGRLLSRIESWNDLAVKHGAARAPYEGERQHLLRMIEWGNAQLQARGADEVVVRGISIGSLRYIKAALVLEIWRLDRGLDDSEELSRAPQAVRDAVSHQVSRHRALANEIQYPAAAILDEFRQEHGSMPAQNESDPSWDVFVSHASEDKASFVDGLVGALQKTGLKTWYDTSELALGDSLRRSIDRGLAHSRFGIVVLSHSFFSKEWPRRELDGLAAREFNGEKVLLPVWHNVGEADVRKYSPMLADRLGVSSNRGMEHVVREVLSAVRRRA